MTDTANFQNGHDVITFLRAQHEEIKALFELVLESTGRQREQWFTQLRRLLAVHETAEEEIVHPRARHAIDGGDAVVSARLEEERAAKATLAELEKLDVDSAEFAAEFAAFHADVLAHAGAEETQEFPALTVELDENQLRHMRAAAKLAEALAPTRPHPGIESAAANLLVGPFAAMLDRARDAISSSR
jgi:hemerythrin superfamily protein